MRRLITFFFLLLVVAVNIYFRSYPINFPQLKARAKDAVERRISLDMLKEVDKDLPGFDSRAKERLAIQKAREYKDKNKCQIKQDIRNEYLKSKSIYQDCRGQTYLMELDPWHWARYVENVLRFGHAGDEVIKGREIDVLMLAPLGVTVSYNKFLFYSSAFLYKACLLIKPIALPVFLFYLPLFFIIIFIVILYIFCLRHWGNISAILACLYVGLAPIFLQRSSAGWFDMDTLNLIFPLLIVWTYLMAQEQASFRSSLRYIFFSSFWVGIFCFTWISWWFIFCIIILYEIISLLGLSFGYRQDKAATLVLSKRHLLSLSCFLIFSFIWIIVFSGPDPISGLYRQITGAINLNKPLNGLIWPNIYSTVSELRKPELIEVINQVGGPLLFASGLCCITLLFVRHLGNQGCGIFESGLRLILCLWFAVMSFAASRGVRFVMFMLIPLGISLGWIASEAYSYLQDKKRHLCLIPLVGYLILCVTMFHNASRRSEGLSPIMNDTYFRFLVTLRTRTPPQSIINSWWDFGDWYKAVARRRVIADGQSQNVPQTYWMARVLLCENEEEAIKILRMLNNGGNSAFELINSYFADPLKSVSILNKLFLLNPQQAEELILKSFPAAVGLKLKSLLFNKPAEAYFIVDYNIRNVIPSISYIGNWNFKKAYLGYNINMLDKEKIARQLSGVMKEGREIEKIYQEAKLLPKGALGDWASSTWRLYDGFAKGLKKGEVILFDNGLVYDLRKKEVFLYSSKHRKYRIPRSLFTFENGSLKETVYPAYDLDLSVLMLKDKDDYQAILLNTQLAKSIFVRLYFLNGVGLKHFKPFIEERIGSDYIRSFEINWE